MKRLWRHLGEDGPDLVVMSPPCTCLCQLQNFTPPHKRRDWQGHLRDVSQAIQYVNMRARMAKYQHKRGRHYLLESSDGARTWRLLSVLQLMKDANTHHAKVSACAVGGRDVVSKLPFVKMWRFVTNGPIMAESLDRLQCSKDGHKHQSVEGSSGGTPRSIQSQIYPPTLVRAMLKAFCRQEAADEVTLCYDDLTVEHVCAAEDDGEELTEEVQKGSETGPEPSWQKDGKSCRSAISMNAAIRRLHINLGHATVADMVRVLKSAGAKEDVLSMARKFKRSLFEPQKGPKLPRPATVPKGIHAGVLACICHDYQAGCAIREPMH